MELEKLTTDDIRKFDTGKSQEVEKEVRKELALLKMDIYQERPRIVGKTKKLKRLLAQVLTIRTEASAS